MYQYDFAEIISEELPMFTCVVPTEWLAKKLPTMGGNIIYIDKLEPSLLQTSFVFEFTHPTSDSTLPWSICLALFSIKDGVLNRRLENPIKISCDVAIVSPTADWCIEVALLCHFFGTSALSAILDNQYLDFSDVLLILATSTEFDFLFCVGDIPSDMMATMLARTDIKKIKSAFPMLFCHRKQIRRQFLEDLVAPFDEECDALILISDVAVNQEKKLISALIGR